MPHTQATIHEDKNPNNLITAKATHFLSHGFDLFQVYWLHGECEFDPRLHTFFARINPHSSKYLLTRSVGLLLDGTFTILS